MTLSSYRGYLYALIAFGTWGFLPVYWKQLQVLPMLEILAHRMIWSAVTMVIALALLKDLSWLLALRTSPRTLLLVSAAALLTAANWITYLWAVDTGNVARISLGYFINPLFSVLLARPLSRRAPAPRPADRRRHRLRRRHLPHHQPRPAPLDRSLPRRNL